MDASGKVKSHLLLQNTAVAKYSSSEKSLHGEHTCSIYNTQHKIWQVKEAKVAKVKNHLLLQNTVVAKYSSSEKSLHGNIHAVSVVAYLVKTEYHLKPSDNNTIIFYSLTVWQRPGPFGQE